MDFQMQHLGVWAQEAQRSLDHQQATDQGLDICQAMYPQRSLEGHSAMVAFAQTHHPVRSHPAAPEAAGHERLVRDAEREPL